MSLKYKSADCESTQIETVDNYLISARVVATTWEAEAGGLYSQEFKTSMGKTPLKNKQFT